MKKILLLIIIATLSINVFSQSLENNTYTVSGEKLVNGNTNMTVSGSAYSTSPITAGGTILVPGFQSIFRSQNNSMVSAIIDSLALVDLYNDTNPGDTTWINTDGWLTAPLSEWNGVTLGPSGRVEEVRLDNNNLVGTMPESMKNLDSLKRFYFWQNPQLSGNLFDFLINFSALERVSAHDCNFTGTILPEVFRPGLLEIRVYNNLLDGEIPVEINNSLFLEQFNVAGNQLVGEIPASITELADITELNLSGNLLTGTLPADFSNLNSLITLNLSFNSITGEIPASIGDLASIINIDLNNNELTGVVPANFENLTTLESLFLYQNDLEGTLPDVIHLPSLINLDVYGNGKLFVEIPDDLGTLTNLETFAIGATVANRGEFPQGFYQLTNLIRLDLGGQQFTGSLSEDVANWTQLDNLYLWQNQLSGAIPTSLASITSLRVLDISHNDFSSVPDFSSTALQELFVMGNQLSFNSLIPNLTIPIFEFKNQSRIGGDADVELSIGENFEISTEIQDQAETSYAWIFNNDTIATDQLILNVTNFGISNSGSYRLLATHPAIEEFVISSGFTNLKLVGAPRSWYVDNRPQTARDFSTLYQAIYASKANDTIYIAGSQEVYQTAGSLLLNSPRVILGPGYFLDQNEDLQFNTDPAVIGDALTLAPGSDGTQIFGLSFSAPVRLNNTFFTEGDTLKNVEFIGNQFLEGSNFGFVSHVDGLTFKGNYDPVFAFYITDPQGEQSGLYASYKNFDISNNINISVRPFSFQFSTSAFNNGMENIEFSHNLIDTIANINDAIFENNIIKSHSANGNTFNNNIDYADNLFENNSGSFIVDSDFTPVDPGLPQGPFSGENPYKLSGIPPIPSIYNIQIGNRLSTLISARSNNQAVLRRLRYQYRRANQSSRPFNVQGFDPATELEVEFLPNRSGLAANQTYNLIFVAIDETGVRSHRTYIPYETIAANLSGNVIDVDNIEVTEGSVRLFAINPFANKYDTAAVQTLAGSNTFNFENLILGDYIILADPDQTQYPNLLPTYLGNTIDWQVADTLFVENNISSISIEAEKVPDQQSEPGSEISGFVEEEFEDADTTLRVLPRRRVSGVGVSVRVLTGSSRPDNSLRLLDDDYELVAYIKTDENGEFTIPNLPNGEYLIRMEYPGVVIDENSDIAFTISGEQGEVINVEALVDEGSMLITETGRITSNDYGQNMVFRFYPNPVKNKLIINLENAPATNELIIFDVRGVVHERIKITEGQHLIDLSKLNAGTYLIRLQDAEGNYLMSKILKE